MAIMKKIEKKYYKWISLAFIILLIAGYYFLKPAPKISYLTSEAKMTDIEDTVLATGTISALKQVQVGAQVSGQIKSLKVKLGQEIKKGDLIAEIDSVAQSNNLLDSKAALEGLLAQLKSSEVALQKSQIQMDRQEKLIKAQASSQTDYDNAVVALAEARANIGQLNANINKARLTVNTSQVNLGYTKIVSPIDGVIVSMPVDEGQTVNSNQAAPTIVKIAQLDTVTVKAEIAEGDVVKVKPGLPVYFTVLGQPTKFYRSTLKSIDPGPQSMSDNTSTTSSGSGTAAIYYYGIFDVANPDKALRISMTAQVSIVLAQEKNVLTVPSSSLTVGRDKKATVKVLEGESVVVKPVVVGVNNKILAQIKEGLKAGDKVITGQATEGQQTNPANMRAARMMR